MFNIFSSKRFCKSSCVVLIFFVALLFAIQPVFGQSGSTGEAYHKAYQQAYQDGLNFLSENKTLIKQELTKHKAPLAWVLPAVFPEVVRFSAIKDQIETFSLQMLYVRFGASYANFSIGRFQMKPSFVEELEAEVLKQNLKAFLFITKFKPTEASEVRQERVRRLTDLSWQLRYLACFQAIVAKKFPWKDFSSEKKVRFLAAAYNRGFLNTQAEIERWMHIKAFPYGANYRSSQYAYTDIAWYFYKNHFSAETVVK